MSAEWLAAIAATATAVIGAVGLIAIFGVRKQIKLQAEQMTRDFENLYVQRYWVIMDRIAAADDHAPDDHRAEGRRNDARYAYLRLCEDQVDLKKADRVSASTWLLWSSAITSECARPEYLGLLDSLGTDELPSLRAHLGR